MKNGREKRIFQPVKISGFIILFYLTVVAYYLLLLKAGSRADERKDRNRKRERCA